MFLQLYPQAKAVFFDLDGTLVDSAPDIAHALNLTLHQYKMPTATLGEVRQWVGRGAVQLVECAFKSNPSRQTEKEQFLKDFLEAYTADVSSRTVLYDGVLPFLKWCGEHQVRMACITNKPFEPAINLLKDLNLIHFFEEVVGGDTYPYRKPHPYALKATLQKMQLQPSDVVMIGDSRNDVEAARNASIPCIALSYGYNHGEPIEACNPERILDSLTELL